MREEKEKAIRRELDQLDFSLPYLFVITPNTDKDTVRAVAQLMRMMYRERRYARPRAAP